MIEGLLFGQYTPTLRSDSIFLSFGSSVRPNYGRISCCYFWRELLLCWEVKNTNMTIVWVPARPFTTSVPYSHLYMIWGGSLMESFTGLLQRLAILQVSECFVEVDARFPQDDDSKHQYWYWTTINYNYSIRRVSFNGPWYTERHPCS